MTLPRITPGDPLSAAEQNRLIDEVNALARPAAVGRACFGVGGIGLVTPPEVRLALFELTGPIVYPQLDGAPSGYFDRDPTPHAPAQLVWCHQHRTEDIGQGSQPVLSYATSSDYAEQTIWFPLCRRNDEGYALGPPVAQAAARVLAVLNRQSGRWEVVQGPPCFMACWGVLDEQLLAGGSATVSLWWGEGDSALNVTAYDWLLKTGTSLAAQTKVKVEFFPQDDKWWVTAAACQ